MCLQDAGCSSEGRIDLLHSGLATQLMQGLAAKRLCSLTHALKLECSDCLLVAAGSLTIPPAHIPSFCTPPHPSQVARVEAYLQHRWEWCNIAALKEFDELHVDGWGMQALYNRAKQREAEAQQVRALSVNGAGVHVPGAVYTRLATAWKWPCMNVYECVECSRCCPCPLPPLSHVSQYASSSSTSIMLLSFGSLYVPGITLVHTQNCDMPPVVPSST